MCVLLKTTSMYDTWTLILISSDLLRHVHNQQRPTSVRADRKRLVLFFGVNIEPVDGADDWLLHSWGQSEKEDMLLNVKIHINIKYSVSVVLFSFTELGLVSGFTLWSRWVPANMTQIDSSAENITFCLTVFKLLLLDSSSYSDSDKLQSVPYQKTCMYFSWFKNSFQVALGLLGSAFAHSYQPNQTLLVT